MCRWIGSYLLPIAWTGHSTPDDRALYFTDWADRAVTNEREERDISPGVYGEILDLGPE